MCVTGAVQRFSQGNVLKKTIFELIAGELLKAAAVPEASENGGGAVDGKASPATGSGHGMRHFRCLIWSCCHHRA